MQLKLGKSDVKNSYLTTMKKILKKARVNIENISLYDKAKISRMILKANIFEL